MSGVESSGVELSGVEMSNPPYVVVAVLLCYHLADG